MDTKRFSKIAQSLESPKLRQITKLIQKYDDSINLGQGTCQLPIPHEVARGAMEAIENGVNRYTLANGLPSLRNEIASKLVRHNGFRSVNPETEIVVTSGSTGAFDAVCATFLRPGDEVVIFEPFYPYHCTTLNRYGAVIRPVSLSLKDLSFDKEALSAAFSSKTRFVIVNTPSNPSGKVFTKEELLFIGELCKKHATWIITDEIYEYMLHDGSKHISPASLPELTPLTVTIGGFSKTFAITGWRIGYLVAPPPVAEMLTRIHDITYICAPSLCQEGVALGLSRLPERFYPELKAKYSRKRELLTKALTAVGFEVRPSQGAYYLIADYGKLFPDLYGMKFVEHLIDKTHVAAVPSDDFVLHPEKHRWVRFCYAVEDSVLEKASLQLASL